MIRAIGVLEMANFNIIRLGQKTHTLKTALWLSKRCVKIIKARVRRPVGITLIAVIAMAAIFGIPGALLAIPVYVTVSEILKSKIDLRIYEKSKENENTCSE